MSVLYVLIFQVLSHNLCTVLCIPHDPVALEEHFRDDDDGPVSSQGYMPYLNKYILDKVIKTEPHALFVSSNCNALKSRVLSEFFQSLHFVLVGCGRLF